MVRPATRSKILQDIQEEDFDKAVDYESDTDFMLANRFSLIILTNEDGSSRGPNPFPECGAMDTLTNYAERALNADRRP